MALLVSTGQKVETRGPQLPQAHRVAWERSLNANSSVPGPKLLPVTHPPGSLGQLCEQRAGAKGELLAPAVIPPLCECGRRFAERRPFQRQRSERISTSLRLFIGCAPPRGSFARACMFPRAPCKATLSKGGPLPLGEGE